MELSGCRSIANLKPCCGELAVQGVVRADCNLILSTAEKSAVASIRDETKRWRCNAAIRDVITEGCELNTLVLVGVSAF